VAEHAVRKKRYVEKGEKSIGADEKPIGRAPAVKSGTICIFNKKLSPREGKKRPA